MESAQHTMETQEMSKWDDGGLGVAVLGAGDCDEGPSPQINADSCLSKTVSLSKLAESKICFQWLFSSGK